MRKELTICDACRRTANGDSPDFIYAPGGHGLCDKHDLCNECLRKETSCPVCDKENQERKEASKPYVTHHITCDLCDTHAQLEIRLLGKRTRVCRACMEQVKAGKHKSIPWQ